MMGFIYKDFMVLRKQMIYILFLLAVYAGLSATDAIGPTILPAIVVIVGLIYPLNAFAYDEQARWDKFAAATPAGRRGMVAARYLFVVLLLVIASVLVTALLTVVRLAGLVDKPWGELLLPVPACGMVGLAMNAVTLPILYKFGPEKSRIISMAIFGLIFAVCFGIGWLAPGGGLPVPSDTALLGLFLGFALLAVAGFVASFFLSLGIFSRKEL